MFEKWSDFELGRCCAVAKQADPSPRKFALLVYSCECDHKFSTDVTVLRNHLEIEASGSYLRLGERWWTSRARRHWLLQQASCCASLPLIGETKIKQQGSHVEVNPSHSFWTGFQSVGTCHFVPDSWNHSTTVLYCMILPYLGR